RDLLDAPARCAQEEDVAFLGLEDHLLVELPDAALAFLRARQEDAVEAAVRDGATVRDRDHLGALARADHARGAVPPDARPTPGELVRGIPARQHVEHA